MIFIPKTYQIPIIHEMKNHDYYGCFAFPGAGKTAISLDTIYKFKDTSLVIAPIAILYTTWLYEYEKWDKFKNLKLSLLHGPNKEINFNKNAGVYLINPEGLSWLYETVKVSKKFPWKNLFIDESARFKSPTAKTRFKLIKKFLPYFKRRYVLCGNPIPNGYLDLWSQIYILDLGKRLGDNWYKYRDRYFYPTDYRRFNWELKPKAKEEILLKISDITTFIDEKDVDEQLPERVEDTIYYDLPKDIRIKYDNMEKKLFSLMDEEYKLANENTEQKIIAETKASALMKCRQIAQGFIYENYEDKNEQGKIVQLRKSHDMHDVLLNLCIEKVEELEGRPVIVVFYFEEDYYKLRKGFPNAKFLYKEESPFEIKHTEEDWNSNKIPVLITQIEKLSHGVNLQYGQGNHIILYALTYNYEIYDQLIRRMQRQNATFNHVFITRLVAKNTVHEAMIASLNKKYAMSTDFFELLKKYKKENRAIE